MLTSEPRVRRPAAGRALISVVAAWCLACPAPAQETSAQDQAEVTPVPQPEIVEVIGTTPITGVGQSVDRFPYQVQTISSEDLQRSLSSSFTDYAERHLGSVSISEAQNHPRQPDLFYRGFVLSPLLGLPQGLSVYQDGVRINEIFGDTMNWDLLPEAAIDRVSVIGGSNPLFGLNTLGGALSLTTKDGFRHGGHRLQLDGGSFGRGSAQFESGGNSGMANVGSVGYFVAGNYFHEDGWQDESESDINNLFVSLDYRSVDEDSSLGLDYTYGGTELIGNGPAPVELLQAEGRSSVFTTPDITENNLHFANLMGMHWITPQLQVSGNLYFRSNDTEALNGDGTEFGSCSFTEFGAMPAPSLCAEDTLGNLRADVNAFMAENPGLLGIDDDTLALELLQARSVLAPDVVPQIDDFADRLNNALIEDQDGMTVTALQADGSTERDAIQNLSMREQRGYGGTVQATSLYSIAGRQNQFVLGGAYTEGRVDFVSTVEVGTLDDNRRVGGTGLFIPEEGTGLEGRTRTFSVYLQDSLELYQDLYFMLAARYNHTRISLSDRGGQSPFTAPREDLNGRHSFSRVNPVVGLSYVWSPGLSLYASYNESSRAPTPIELVCADAEAPCSLPNAFLADPPLEQVVLRGVETGARGSLGAALSWNLGLYYTQNEDDIIFQSTGGISSNEGFFANVGDTRRWGGELGLSGSWRRLGWGLNYGYVRATYEDEFQVSSPNHPFANDDNEGLFSVSSGDRIPGIPEHSVKARLELDWTKSLRIGTSSSYYSDRFRRGDEANLDEELEDYFLTSVYADYRPGDVVSFFLKIDNVFDTNYETFGLYGEPDEVLGAGFENPRFVSPGRERSLVIGLRVSI